VIIDPEEAEVVRQIYRLLVEERMSLRQITNYLNQSQAKMPARSGRWLISHVRLIVTNPAYMGRARGNYRSCRLPQQRRKELSQVKTLNR